MTDESKTADDCGCGLWVCPTCRPEYHGNADRPETAISEDEWREAVFEEMEIRALLLGCERQCFTFACRCRNEAIACVTELTGVNFNAE